MNIFCLCMRPTPTTYVGLNNRSSVCLVVVKLSVAFLSGPLVAVVEIEAADG